MKYRDRVCHYCKIKYQPTTHPQKFCSEDCRYNKKKERARKATKSKQSRRVPSSSVGVRGQNKAYILALSEGCEVVAIKFGITKNLERRLRKLRATSIYTIEEIGTWKFPNSSSCREAEACVKSTLQTGVVLKRDMEDGYTETLHPCHIEVVIEIYRRNGGVIV